MDLKRELKLLRDEIKNDELDRDNLCSKIDKLKKYYINGSTICNSGKLNSSNFTKLDNIEKFLL